MSEIILTKNGVSTVLPLYDVSGAPVNTAIIAGKTVMLSKGPIRPTIYFGGPRGGHLRKRFYTNFVVKKDFENTDLSNKYFGYTFKDKFVIDGSDELEYRKYWKIRLVADKMPYGVHDRHYQNFGKSMSNTIIKAYNTSGELVLEKKNEYVEDGIYNGAGHDIDSVELDMEFELPVKIEYEFDFYLGGYTAHCYSERYYQPAWKSIELVANGDMYNNTLFYKTCPLVGTGKYTVVTSDDKILGIEIAPEFDITIITRGLKEYNRIKVRLKNKSSNKWWSYILYIDGVENGRVLYFTSSAPPEDFFSGNNIEVEITGMD